jgi:hypothetical protein
MEPGMYVVIVIVLLFYLRVYLIRRGRKRREKLELLNRIQKGKKGAPLPEKNVDAPVVKVKSWWFIGLGFLIMLLGLAMYSDAFFVEYHAYWSIPVAIGGLLFIIGIE